MSFKFDVEAVRKQFPACSIEIDGTPIAYLDGPGGTQVPQQVLDAITGYLVNDNANEDGNFTASYKARQVEDAAREAAADFLGCDPEEIGFNCASTQNCYNLAINLSKTFKPGDELIITEIDHQCNIAPWESLQRMGCVVKTVKLDTKTQQLDFEDFKSKLSDKTKVVAVNWASNGLGTITDVKKFIDEAHKYGALTVIDAVHYAAHLPIDVKAIGTDALLCSSYKWFGPHMGVIYLRKELIDSLDFNNAGADDISEGARKFHMGTPQYEHLCGIRAAIDFIASIGEKYVSDFADELEGLEGRRRNVVAGMLAIDAYEAPLAEKLRKGLRRIEGVNVYGPAEGQPRTPTVVFTMDNYSPEFVTKVFGSKAINSWNGDFYAIKAIKAIGLSESGGVIRLGLAPYCTEGDIDRVLSTVVSIAAGEYDSFEE
ncbi:cysteine desulfurase-like protein [Gallibacter sp. Marseille-QA0791]|uniref:cysteine desulfurase-like protein n=1 Tax=Gallibacter sp. Marseille-QA0791 TaxID=3378781 RepID=UPI003D0C7CDB